MRRHDLTNAMRIAWRYFFSPKSTHAVHVIAIVAVVGIALVTLAMVVVMSVFNGFECFTDSQLSTLSPAYKLQRSDGQVFASTTFDIPYSAGVLEEVAVAQFEENSQTVRIVGLTPEYQQVVPIDQFIYQGDFDLGDSEAPTAVIGIGVAMNLGAGVGYLSPLEIILPKRIGRISVVHPARGFNRGTYHITGLFRVDQPEDTEVVFLPIEQVRELLQYDSDEVSYIALPESFDPSSITLPAGFQILDRYEQHPEIYKVLRVEKWISFLLLLFVLLLSLFSVVSTLGMLIIEKRDDAQTLRFLGARPSMVDRVIQLEGWLLTITGLVIGLLLGVVLVLLQAEYGFVKLGGGNNSAFLLDAYPVDLRITDLLWITLIILIVGWLSSQLAYRLFRWNKK